jgi:DNA helicase HerA-like ATPase
MNTPLDRIAALTIGTVEFVSPSEIKVLLETDAPQATALNTGSPTGFPRVNGYVLIPNETGAVVGLISWIGIEHSKYPKRAGLKDFGLVDLPFPLRKMSLTPIGTLILSSSSEVGMEYELKRGVSVLPSVGDTVLLPTSEQLQSIVESKGADRRIKIGIAPLAGGASVAVDPDKLFGRHLAVLGNTGSGKSCTVAGIIRWSLENAEKEKGTKGPPSNVNARFIILDPNGEYSNAFGDLNARIFKVPPIENNQKPLQVPGWMWNSEEWCACSSAAPGAQRPVLLQALRELRCGGVITNEFIARACRTFRSYRAQLDEMIMRGVMAYSGFPANKNCGEKLINMATDAENHANHMDCQEPLKSALTELCSKAREVGERRRYSFGQNQIGYNDFSETEINEVSKSLDGVVGELPTIIYSGVPSEDAPIKFDINQMASHLETVASGYGTGQFIPTLTMRIKMMLADQRLGPIISPEEEISFEQWLNDYIGEDGASNGEIAILDLSLVPSDVLHIVIAIIGRLVFEALQRYRKVNHKELPTVIVLEEAHSFIRVGDDDNTAIHMCRSTFERIAREGRKFGLGLVLASQRPSEISATVLAQCNTYIMHRIVNDRDQQLVGRLVPDSLGVLLGELPNLPTRQAILLGWATPVPVLLEVNEIEESKRPRSSDPSFWSVWIGDEERRIDWKKIVEDWTK